MNNIIMLKAQYKLTMQEGVEPRAKPGIENYVAALEAEVERLKDALESKNVAEIGQKWQVTDERIKEALVQVESLLKKSK